MRVAALVVALFAITIGVVGIVSPDGLTAARRHVADTPGGLYVTGSIRVAMGLVLILFAPRSRAPKILCVLGAIMALQGIVQQFIGMDREQMILEQEMWKVAALRLGAGVALATGCFIAFVVTPLPKMAGLKAQLGKLLADRRSN
jgi:hypothetical protein